VVVVVCVCVWGGGGYSLRRKATSNPRPRCKTTSKPGTAARNTTRESTYPSVWEDVGGLQYPRVRVHGWGGVGGKLGVVPGTCRTSGGVHVWRQLARAIRQLAIPAMVCVCVCVGGGSALS
jgi:hypothetical protein